jgi:hypothetical protein
MTRYRDYTIRPKSRETLPLRPTVRDVLGFRARIGGNVKNARLSGHRMNTRQLLSKLDLGKGLGKPRESSHIRGGLDEACRKDKEKFRPLPLDKAGAQLPFRSYRDGNDACW